jgi:hypothetical protein
MAQINILTGTETAIVLVVLGDLGRSASSQRRGGLGAAQERLADLRAGPSIFLDQRRWVSPRTVPSG